jgi:hypothetical protein
VTDAFASGDPLSGDTPSAPRRAPDVGATLSELEHKLRELELELSAVRRNPPTVRAPGEVAAPPQAHRPSAVAPSTSSARLVDEALEPEGAPPVGAPPVGEARPAGPADPPPRFPDAGFARYATVAASEPEPLAPPPEPAATGTAQLVADVRGRMAEVADQLEQLMRLRRELELRAHELESVAQPPATQPPPEPVAGAVSWPRPDSPSLLPGPARAAGAAGAAGAATGEAAWFEGHVEVDAGPFADITALGDFELKLAQLPQVAAARVRGYGANRALIDVHLSGPAALVRDLRGVWGTGFTVLEAQAGRLSLVLDSALAGERWG